MLAREARWYAHWQVSSYMDLDQQAIKSKQFTILFTSLSIFGKIYIHIFTNTQSVAIYHLLQYAL